MARSFRARTLIPRSGGAAGGREARAAGRRVRAHRQLLMTTQEGGRCGVLTWRAAVRSVKFWQTKSPLRCSRGHPQSLDDTTMPVICPTSQIRNLAYDGAVGGEVDDIQMPPASNSSDSVITLASILPGLSNTCCINSGARKIIFGLSGLET
jgi:hypothetical protein